MNGPSLSLYRARREHEPYGEVNCLRHVPDQAQMIMRAKAGADLSI